MFKHKVAVIGGDGIGPEVIAEGVKILKKVAELDGSFDFEFEEFPWGCEYYLETGKMMPDDGMEKLSKFDAIFLGAVGAPTVPDHISSCVNIRTRFGCVFVCHCVVKILANASALAAFLPCIVAKTQHRKFSKPKTR